MDTNTTNKPRNWIATRALALHLNSEHEIPAGAPLPTDVPESMIDLLRGQNAIEPASLATESMTESGPVSDDQVKQVNRRPRGKSETAPAHELGASTSKTNN